MKEIVLESHLEECNAQQYYDWVYGDEDAMRRYHAEVDKDDQASVTLWQDGKRTVSFVMDLAIPATMRRFIGAEPVRVCEQQSITWHADGGFTLLSEPTMEITGGANFTTAAEIYVSDAPGGTCHVQQTVRCSAALPWPMQSTVETIMAEAAKPAIQKFLDFCAKVVIERSEQQAKQQAVQEAAQEVSSAPAGQFWPNAQEKPQPVAQWQPRQATAGVAGGSGRRDEAVGPLPASPPLLPRPQSRAVGLAGPGESAAVDLEDFYDAYDALSDTHSIRGSTSQRVHHTSHQLDLLLQKLQVMCQDRETTNRHLESISKSLQHLDENVSRAVAYQEGLQEGRRHAAVESTASGTRSLLLIAAVSAALSSSMTVLYMRRRG